MGAFEQLFGPVRGKFEQKLYKNSNAREVVACVAGVRRGRKEERRAREAREDRTLEDPSVPSPSRVHFDFPPFLLDRYRYRCLFIWSLIQVHRLFPNKKKLQIASYFN